MKRRSLKPGLITLVSGAIVCFFCVVIIAVNAFQYQTYYMDPYVTVSEAGYIDYGNGTRIFVGTKTYFLRPLFLGALGFAFGLFLIVRGLRDMAKSAAPAKKTWRLPGV